MYEVGGGGRWVSSVLLFSRGGGEHSTHAAAHPGEEKSYMQMDLACTTESCGVPEACAAETDVGMWQVLGGLCSADTGSDEH